MIRQLGEEVKPSSLVSYHQKRVRRPVESRKWYRTRAVVHPHPSIVLGNLFQRLVKSTKMGQILVDVGSHGPFSVVLAPAQIEDFPPAKSVVGANQSGDVEIVVDVQDEGSERASALG
jgi:hypothetical protein